MSKYGDYTKYIGERFGSIVVETILPYEYYPNGRRKPAMCVARCDCGNRLIITIISLINGQTKSCGCAALPEGVYAESYTRHNMVVRTAKAHSCPFPEEDCVRSLDLAICCCECEKKEKCALRCSNTPDKCGAGNSRKGDWREIKRSRKARRYMR